MKMYPSRIRHRAANLILSVAATLFIASLHSSSTLRAQSDIHNITNASWRRKSSTLPDRTSRASMPTAILVCPSH
jgi:hypothetical protein